MLEVVALHAGYGDVQALFGVSFTVREGSIMAILGPNGAGKSTILRAISGLLRPSAGDIRFEGVRLNGMAPYDIAELGIAHVPEGRRVFPSLSVEENLIVGSYSKRARPHRGKLLAEVYDLFPRLRERRQQLAGSLSGGEQQMLVIGRGLMLNPRLLMMDEPSLGLAPILVDMVFEKIRAISQRGITMLLVEQNAAACLSTAVEGCVLEHGQEVCRGTREQLLGTRIVQEAYLGV
ncbi:MAG TPA: ABC transporter ATP-binding protein [Thermoleophilia bacterium]|nr:MAG: branched-chain amino acid ABC transporter ATP-binding protein [candidate division NC10 bacterium RIFCSPLOWO2_02_FULL_66_22]HLA80903.1 ABC transporter ATP-binding protein [Thermoleophilia bacterium]